MDPSLAEYAHQQTNSASEPQATGSESPSDDFPKNGENDSSGEGGDPDLTTSSNEDSPLSTASDPSSVGKTTPSNIGDVTSTSTGITTPPDGIDGIEPLVPKQLPPRENADSVTGAKEEWSSVHRKKKPSGTKVCDSNVVGVVKGVV